jgi:localization factor PodJL
MNKAVPWNVKGVGADVREAAKEAARRAGLSLGEWLNTVIADQAAELGIEPQDMDSDARLAALTQRLQVKPAEAPVEANPPPLAKERAPTSLAAMAAQLTEMGQRMGRRGQDLEPSAADSHERSDLTNKLNALLELLIAQRNRPSMPAAGVETSGSGGEAPAGGQGLARDVAPDVGQMLDGRFADAIAQIERAMQSLRSDWDAKALDGLRAEFERLGARLETGVRPETTVLAFEQIAQEVIEISRTVALLAPRDRLNAIEAALAGLTQRIDDLPDRTLLPVEAMAADIRTMIQNADPREMIATLDGELSAIAHKIEILLQPPNVPKFDELTVGLRALHHQFADFAARPAPQIEAVERQIGALADGLERLRQDMASRQSDSLLARTIDDLRDNIQAMNRPWADTLDRGLASLTGQIERMGSDFHEAHKAPAAWLEDRLSLIDAKLATLGDPTARQAETIEIVRQIDTLLAEHSTAQSIAALDTSLGQLRDLLERSSTLQLTRAEDGRLTLRRLEAIEERLAQPLEASPAALRPIEEQVRALSDQLGASQPDAVALAALETQVSRILERIERSDEGLISLTSLQRSILDLFSRLDETRQTTLEAVDSAARGAAQSAVEVLSSRQSEPAGAVASEAIARQLADIRQSQENADRRVYATLTAVHATLEKVVTRLSQLDRRQDSRPPEPFSAGEPALTTATPAAPPPVAAIAPLPTAVSPAIPPDAEGFDVLIEPGSGLSPSRKAGAPVEDSPLGSPAAGQAGFIAAARRAAQAAAAEAALAAAQKRGALPAETAGGAAPAPRPRPSRRLWFVGFACVALCAAAAAVYFVMPSGETIGEAIVPPRSAEGDQAKEHAPPLAGEGQVAPLPGPDALKPPQPPQPQPRTENAPAPESPMQSLLLAPTGQVPGAAFLPLASTNPVYPALATPGNTIASAGPEPALAAAAAAGNAAAQYELGVAYFDGRNVTRDQKAAAQWLEKAATQGLAPAQYRLATLFEKGLGVGRDPSLAKLWYQRASERGNARAMHNLAVLTAEGATGKPDYATAAIWFKKAAELGVADSQFNLAILYARGLGVDLNLSQSYVWFAVAAGQGDEDAAKKRDEVAAKLDSAALEPAKALVSQFKPKAIDPAANEVSAPPGGWDTLGQKADSKTPARLPARPKVTRL